MISCMKRNIKNIWSKKIPNLVIIFTITLIALYYMKINNDKIYINIISTNINTINTFIYIIYRLIYFGYLMYMSYCIYAFDLKNNPEFLFLRISSKKILLVKYISLLLLNLCTSIIILTICVILTKNINIYYLKIIINAMVYNLTIQCIFYVLVSYFNQYSIIMSVIMYILPILLKTNITGNLWFIVIEILIILTSYIMNQKLILKIIERNKQ